MLQHHSFGTAALVDEVIQPGSKVLDLGCLSFGTTQTFLELSCQTFIEDLRSLLLEIYAADTQSRAVQLSGHLTKKPQRVKIDIVLCWDLFNFMEPELIARLIEEIRPHLKPGTIFLTMLYTGTMPKAPADFKRLTGFTFNTEPLDLQKPLPTYRYSSLKLMKTMGNFSLRSSLLHRKGMRKDLIELMFEYGNAKSQNTVRAGGSSGAISAFRKTRLTELLFPALDTALAQVARSPVSKIFDIGQKAGRNIQQLQRSVGELFISDLYSAILWQCSRKVPFDGAVQAALRQATLPDNLDCILLWDLLNFFSAEEIQSITNALYNYLSDGGVMHFLLFKQEQLPINCGVFEIQPSGHVGTYIHPYGNKQAKFRTVTDVVKSLPQMKVLNQSTGRIPSGPFYHEITMQKVVKD
ncbi:class I SAM-dependent methyltransferase [uncultured Microbulbifer sp.]|uniref:class I SAM-dependent methyltransferase n=1 Tax=uncultured Microbulbifer sp. TaxID=348147 RepID=UPI00261BA9A1|nr:class I SAM-dependent methyltransferase [uncultured Microbulbifer sp.]